MLVASNEWSPTCRALHQGDEIKAGAGSQVARYLTHEGPPPREEPPPKEKEDARQAGEVGAAAPPTDVDTTGGSQEIDPLAATTAPEDWTQSPYVQIEGGFLAGVSLGLVPMGAVGHQLLDAGEVLSHGTPEARFGLAVGQIVGGIASMAGGVGGGLLGGATTATGAGAPVGVPAMVVSAGLVVGGAANVAAGIWGLTQAMSKGSGSTSPKAAAPTATSRSSATSRAAAIMKPGGVKLGTPGSSDRIRFLNGGTEAAQRLMARLLGGGATRVTPPGSVAEVFELAEGGTVSLRTVSSTDGVVATIDVAIEGIGISKIKFLP